jgi:hypothetical protein
MKYRIELDLPENKLALTGIFEKSFLHKGGFRSRRKQSFSKENPY